MNDPTHYPTVLLGAIGAGWALSALLSTSTPKTRKTATMDHELPTLLDDLDPTELTQEERQMLLELVTERDDLEALELLEPLELLEEPEVSQ